MAHVGDSRAIVGLRNITNNMITAMPITKDHKPTDKEEKMRIMSKGGVVRKDADDVFHRVY